MDKSILVRVFNSLNKKEIRDFGLFVRSPYFNRREKVVQLYDYLVESIDLPEGILKKERVWKHLFPNKEYDDREMRYTMSFLLKVIRQYLMHSELEQDKSKAQILLCQSLQNHGLGKLMDKEINLSLQHQDKQPLRHAFYYLDNYQLIMEQGKYITQQRRTGDLPLQKLFNELTYFYIAEVLRQSCNVLNHQTVSTQDYVLRFQEEVIRHVEKHDYSHVPAISIYYHSYKALSDMDNESDFAQLKNLIEQHWASFPSTESHGLYVLAINYCIRRLNKGDRKYIREGFELYKSGFQNNLLLENGILSTFTYTNASRLGLALDEFDWVERFLHTYKPTLSTDKQESIYLYNLAFLNYQKKDYDKAMECLQQVSFDDVFYSLDSRRIMLRIYYEQQEVSALLSLLDSFTIYISRHKQIGYHRENYTNLIRFVKKMLNSNLSSSKVREKIIEDINATPSIADKQWLLEQLGAKNA